MDNDTTAAAPITTATVAKTYRVPEENLLRLRERIEKLAKRAKKLGAFEIALSETGEIEVEKYRDEDGRLTGRVIRWHKITLTGTSPKLAGWTFVGVLQHLDGVDGNVIRTVPGHVMPIEYRKVASECQHCKTNRRRKDTFVVQNDGTGDHQQVGRNCLADFLGHRDPHQVASYAEYLFTAASVCEESENEMGGGGGGKMAYVDMVSYLSYVAACIRTSGWISRKAAYESDDGKMATADEAWDAMFPPRGLSRTDIEKLPRPSEKDTARAKAALDYAEHTLTPRDSSDYEYNLKLICGQGSDVLHVRCTGIAASLLPAHTRWLGWQEEKKQLPASTAYFGEIGKREVFVLTVIGVREMEGRFGPSTLVTFRTADGLVGKWFATGSCDIEIGETYRVKATVKKHDEWKGEKQTGLSRCDIVGKASDPEPVKAMRKPREKKPSAETVAAVSDAMALTVACPLSECKSVIDAPCRSKWGDRREPHGERRAAYAMQANAAYGKGPSTAQVDERPSFETMVGMATVEGQVEEAIRRQQETDRAEGEALRVDCPKSLCGAKVGEPCRSPNSHKREHHESRLARRARERFAAQQVAMQPGPFESAVNASFAERRAALETTPVVTEMDARSAYPPSLMPGPIEGAINASLDGGAAPALATNQTVRELVEEERRIAHEKEEAARVAAVANRRATGKRYWLPTIPYSVVDAINRIATATGSPAYAAASADAGYNGHPVSVYFNDFRGYWLAEYSWAGRNVLARGGVEGALRAGKAEYARGARGCSVQTEPLDEEGAKIAEALGYAPWSKEIEAAHDATWVTDRHELVGDAVRCEKQLGVPAISMLVMAASAAEYQKALQEGLDARRRERELDAETRG